MEIIDKKRIFVDMDDTLCLFEKGFNKERESNPAQPFHNHNGGSFLD